MPEIFSWPLTSFPVCTIFSFRSTGSAQRHSSDSALPLLTSGQGTGLTVQSTRQKHCRQHQAVPELRDLCTGSVYGFCVQTLHLFPRQSPGPRRGCCGTPYPVRKKDPASCPDRPATGRQHILSGYPAGCRARMSCPDCPGDISLTCPPDRQTAGGQVSMY